MLKKFEKSENTAMRGTIPKKIEIRPYYKT